ncbi:MAG: hypothetical protein ABGY41_09715, partial [Candidatus Poribacteria bacterium]
MRLFGELQSRGARLGLVGLVAGVLIYAGLQLSGVFGGADAREQREQDLADAQLMAKLAPIITDAHTAFQGTAGMDGSELPDPVVERLKASYTLDNEDGKTRLRAASATALAGALAIDDASAEFIIEGRDLGDWDALTGRKRGLFDENRATLQALVYAEISKVAAESGIGKLDSVKVEAPRSVRGRTRTAAKKPVSKPNANSIRELRDHIKTAREALETGDETALSDGIAAAVSLAVADPSVRRSARADLLGLLDVDGLADTHTARVRLAVLGSQPDAMRAALQILGAHIEDALAVIPEPPAPPTDDEDGEDGDGDEESEEGDGDRAVEDGDKLAEEDDTSSSDDDDELAEDAETPADDDADGSDTGDREDGDTVADAADAQDGDADETGPSEDPLPPYSDDPVVFHSEPFPALPTLPASMQRRLLVALRDGGGAWLTDAQVAAVLNPPDPPTDGDVEADEQDSDAEGDGPSDEVAEDGAPEDNGDNENAEVIAPTPDAEDEDADAGGDHVESDDGDAEHDADEDTHVVESDDGDAEHDADEDTHVVESDDGDAEH